MEIQETAAVTPRQMIHLQVAGEHSQEDLVSLITQFQETLRDNGVIATPSNVVASVINTTTDLAGMILTPKMTALEIASIAVDVLNAYNFSKNSEVAPVPFADFEEDAKLEVLGRIQQVLHFGAFQTQAQDADEAMRDAIFGSVIGALGKKLTAPSTENLITVTRIAQKEGDEDFDISFKDLVNGDIFKHGEATFVAESNPYVNWVTSPLPIITIDAKLYQEPVAVAPSEVKGSAPSKKKVQSTPSKSTAKARKK